MRIKVKIEALVRAQIEVEVGACFEVDVDAPPSGIEGGLGTGVVEVASEALQYADLSPSNPGPLFEPYGSKGTVKSESVSKKESHQKIAS
ncbi:MAG: hypothetical protein ACRBK7_12480 [Acidimicrobiales bacterium]